MKIQKLSNPKQYKSWFSSGCFTSAQNIQRLAESLTHELSKQDVLTKKCLEVWFQGSTLLSQLLLFVSVYLFNISHKEKAAIASDKTGTYVQSSIV